MEALQDRLAAEVSKREALENQVHALQAQVQHIMSVLLQLNPTAMALTKEQEIEVLVRWFHVVCPEFSSGH